MHIIPVIDLMKGVVVRGVGGRRDEYRPIITPLTTTPEPLAVARAFRDHFDLNEIYVADLDAIAGHSPALQLYEQLIDDGFWLWADAGIRSVADARALAEIGVPRIVAGLETMQRPELLQDIVDALGDLCVVFSLDLKGGQPLRQGGGWQPDPWGIARQAVEVGVRHIIVLDLARVGSARGTGTELFCARFIHHCMQMEVTAGGGVRDREDLLRLHEADVNNVLIASALHDGRLRRGDWDDLIDD